MDLLDEIIVKCSKEVLQSRDTFVIRDIVNKDRTKPSTREIGNGTILETIGLQYGNAMLDVLYNAPDFRHVKPLLEQGRLIIGSPLVVATVQSMVPSIMPQPVADMLLSLTTEPHPITEYDVRKALYADNGDYLA